MTVVSAAAAARSVLQLQHPIVSMTASVITWVPCGHIQWSSWGSPGAQSRSLLPQILASIPPPPPLAAGVVPLLSQGSPPSTLAWVAPSQVAPFLARVAPFSPSQDMRLEHSCGVPNTSLTSSCSIFAYAVGGEVEHHTPQWGCPGVHLHPSQDGGPGPHV